MNRYKLMPNRDFVTLLDRVRRDIPSRLMVIEYAYRRGIILFPYIHLKTASLKEVQRAACYGVNIFKSKLVSAVLENECISTVETLRKDAMIRDGKSSYPMAKPAREYINSHQENFFKKLEMLDATKEMKYDDMEIKVKLCEASFNDYVFPTLELVTDGFAILTNDVIPELGLGVRPESYFIYNDGTTHLVLPTFLKDVIVK